VTLLAGSSEVWRVPLDGDSPERWATLGDPLPAGIACDEKGRLFVAIYGTRSDAIPRSVALVERDRPPRALPAPSDGTVLGTLNGIVAIPGLGVYASDSTKGLLIRVRESTPDVFETSVVASDVGGANGLAYDALHDKLYAVSGAAKTLYSFDVASDGSLGARSAVPTSATFGVMDGVAVDEDGTAYVADYRGGAVIRLSDAAVVARAANPASLAFRGGTLLFTDFNAAGGLHAIDLGVCGASP
jgi:sugar lactone lactonase YvrE